LTLPDLTLPSALSLAAVGVVAGISNAIAGGGTLFSFPDLDRSNCPGRVRLGRVPQTACAFAGATIVGCLLGSRLARLMSPKLLRLCVIAFGCALSGYYLFKYHGRSDA